MAVEADALARVYGAGEGEDVALREEALADDRARPCGEALDESDTLKRVYGQIDRLDDRESFILRMKFGLAPYEPTTLVGIGHQLGISRAHVCRLANRAMAKLVGAMAGQEAGELVGV